MGGPKITDQGGQNIFTGVQIFQQFSGPPVQIFRNIRAGGPKIMDRGELFRGVHICRDMYAN